MSKLINPFDARPDDEDKTKELTPWDRQTLPKEGTPSGWIQWKGTNVCMDIYCECGHHSHIDDDFVYYVRCPHCKTVYMTNGHIELVKLTPEEAAIEDVKDAE